MDEEIRKSKRNIKINQDPAFNYDDESIKFLVNTSASRGADNEERHHRNSTESVSSEPIAVADSSIFVSSSDKVAIASPTIWTQVLKSLPLYSNTIPVSVNQLSGIPVVYASASQSSGLVSSPPNSLFGSGDLTAVVNKALYGEVQCRISSTAEDFLDASKNIFLAVSPAAHSDISGMVLTDEVMGGGDKCGCSGDNSCSDCAGKVTGAPLRASIHGRTCTTIFFEQPINKTKELPITFNFVDI